MESIVERAGQATDSAPSKMLGSSANPTPPCFHQHCPFRRLGKLIASDSSGPTAVHPMADAASLRLGHFLISSSFQVNHLIDKGKWWRLATSNFLHVNIVHLLLNSLSVDAIGHKVEAVAGPERFLTVYATSAIASQAMSYRLNKAFSVGASGPICGLVGYLAVYFLRHGGPTGDANKVLNFIATMIIFNMVVGLSAKRIDIWGHVGGFLGGAATSWLLDPAGKLEYRSSDGRTITINIKGREKARGSRK